MKINNVTCAYTGGGVWLYHAKWGNLWLYGSLSDGIDAWAKNPDESMDKWRDHCLNGTEYDCDEDVFDESIYDYLVNDKVKDLPTWSDILQSLYNSDTYADNLQEAVDMLKNCQSDVMDKPCNIV